MMRLSPFTLLSASPRRGLGRFLLLVLAVASAGGSPGGALAAPAAPPAASPRPIEINTARVRLRDLGIKELATQDVDLGPAPPLGSTRTIERGEISRALAAAHAPPSSRLPDRVRVVRKGRHLVPADIDRLVRAAVDPTRLPKGATIALVRGAAIEVPDGFDRVSAELPALPRRSGSVMVTASVSFLQEGVVLARVAVPVEIAIPAEALIPDGSKGAPILLIVRRGLVEVSIGGVAGADGDAGGVLPVLLRPSGRVVRAHVVDKDHAVAIEEP